MVARVASTSSRRVREGGVEAPSGKGPQGSSDDVSCREVARFSKGRKEHHAWSGRYATEAHDPPAQDGRAEREHVASWFGANPTTGLGAHSRQSGNSSAKVCHDRPRSAASLLWVAEVVDAGEAVGRVSRVAAARGGRRGACRAVWEEIPWDTVSLRHPRRGPPSSVASWELTATSAGGGTSGGEGGGPSFVPCRAGGVRLRSSRRLSHKSASGRVFETLGIGPFKLERHPWYPDQGHQCRLERPGCSSSLSPRRCSSKQKPDRGGLQWTANA